MLLPALVPCNPVQPATWSGLLVTKPALKENTRFRSNEELSRLNLLLTKELEVISKVNYQCSLGKSDHVLIEFKVNYSIKDGRGEEHKNGRYNYGKADFEKLRTFSAETD